MLRGERVVLAPLREADLPVFHVRGAFFNDGRNHDVALYGLLRDDPRPWHTAGG